VFTHIDGDRINDAQDALNFIARKEPGETLRIRGLRDGEPFESRAEVGKRPTARR
jgi:serine protease DegS